MSTSTKMTGSRRQRPTTANQAAKNRRASISKATSPAMQETELTEQLRELRLPMFREHFASQAQRATEESLSHTEYLGALAELECQARRESRIARMLHQSCLPSSKTWSNFDWKRLPLQVARQLESLRDGSFLDRRENLLLFGKPGSGKPRPT